MRKHYTLRASLAGSPAEIRDLAVDWLLTADAVYGEVCRDRGELPARTYVSYSAGREIHTWDIDRENDFPANLAAQFEDPDGLWILATALGWAGMMTPRFRIETTLYGDGAAVSVLVRVSQATNSELVGDTTLPAFLLRFLETHVVDYADIGVNWDRNSTALEESVRIPWRSASERILLGKEHLRGYSWVMGFPQERVEPIGGIRALEASGAFETVRLLGTGMVFLQAAASDLDFDPARMRAVFEMLSPLLPSGMPELDAIHGEAQRYPIVYEDARPQLAGE